MFHPATKLIIITEHFISQQICEIIDELHGKGYTMIPAGGKGLYQLHPTSKKATVVEGFDNLRIEVVTREREVAEAIAERLLKECFQDYSGVMYLENVEVCRPERF